MASIYKNFGPNDVVATRTLLNENIPISSSVISASSYVFGASSSNVKTYTHGMFESVYDYPYLSASANELFSITAGRSSYDSSSAQDVKKKTIYNQMAKILLGHDSTGSIYKFDDNGLAFSNTDTNLDNMYFLNFSRLLTKDEIKKGTFSLEVGIGTNANPLATYLTLRDVNGATNYRSDSPSGEYSILYVLTSSNASNPLITGSGVYAASQVTSSQGLIFYQAGIVALSPYIFSNTGSDSPSTSNSTFNSNTKGLITGSAQFLSYSGGGTAAIGDVFVSGTIQEAAENLRRRIRNVSFNNTTELNSTVYFCRVQNNEFNYSSNPTYLVSGSEVRVKTSNALNAPVSYITTVGLYSSDNQLLAVAKLSEPVKKDPTQELILRVRLDY